MTGPRGVSPLSLDTTSPFEDQPAHLDRLRLVVDGMSEGFGLLGPDFTILELNQEAVRLDGRPREALVGRSHWDVYPGTESSDIAAHYRRAMRERVPVTFQHCYRWQDGRESWLDTRAYPTLDGGLAIFYRDVTEQVNAEQRRQQSEDRFRAAVEAIDGVLWTNDADGQMRGEQPAWSALTGQTHDAYQGYGWAAAVHPDDAQPTVDAWRKAVASRTPFIFQHRVRRHDGAWRLFSIRAIPVTRDDGSIREWVGVHRDITELYEAEERLERNAETFASLVSANPFGVYVVDADFRIRLVGKGARKVFENFEPVEGRDFAELMRALWTEPYASETIAHFKHTLETGEPFATTIVEQRADTDDRQAYDWQIARLMMPDGRYGVVAYFYDLTERQRWADELSASRAREENNAKELAALYAEAPLGLAMIDADLRFVRINAALAEMNGFPIAAHIGKSVWDLLPGLRETAEPLLKRVLETGERLRDVPIKGVTPAQPGVEREWCEHFYPVRDEAGTVVGIGIVAEEVTERRRQERALRDSEDELRRVLDQLFAFVGILKPDGTVAYANRPPLDAAGIDLSRVVGAPFAEAPWWSYDPAVQARLETAIADAAAGKTVRYDVPVRLGDTLQTIDFQLSPLRDRDGAITGLIPSGVIVEKRVQAENALRALTDQLEAQVERRTAALNAANARLTDEIARREAAQEALVQSQKLEAMGQLVAGVSHDFNNILAAVLSGLTLIDRKVSDPVAREMVEMSMSAARRGAGLVKQLLAFAHQQPLSPERVDLHAFFTEFRPLLEVSLPHHIAFDVACAPDCRAVMVDPAQLQAALLNLAINARDAMPDGGTLSVTAARASFNGDVRPGGRARPAIAITLEDSGCGMPPEVLARVTEPFFTTKDVGKGTGLGVAMVHGFVTQSGGRLDIQSSVGVGTKVTLTLPEADAEAGREDQAVPTPGRDRPARILMVDDDRDFRGVAAATLIELGHDVVAASSADTALVLLEADRFDLVLTDVAMPDVDGIELARRIAARDAAPPVVFMSGHVDTSTLATRHVLRKPFSTDELSRVIADACKADAPAATDGA